MGAMKDIWQGVKILTQFSWLGSKFVAKNTPAALGMLWEVKKEISATVAQGLHDAHIEYKKNLLDQKIALIEESQKIDLEKIILFQEKLLNTTNYKKKDAYDL